jgi:hypothetical protein
MGEGASGMMMYTPDGYMSAQLLSSQERPSVLSSDEEWAQIGKTYIAFTGAFFLDETGDEKGTILRHQMRTSNLPQLQGDMQRRLCKITNDEDGMYLTIAPTGPMKIGPDGLERILFVRWKKMPSNCEGS